MQCVACCVLRTDRPCAGRRDPCAIDSDAGRTAHIPMQGCALSFGDAVVVHPETDLDRRDWRAGRCGRIGRGWLRWSGRIGRRWRLGWSRGGGLIPGHVDRDRIGAADRAGRVEGPHLQGVEAGLGGDVWGLDGQWYVTGDTGLKLWSSCTRVPIWRSSNYGASWELKCAFPEDFWYDRKYITGLWDDPGHLFGAVEHVYNNPIFESLDAGGSWNHGDQYYGGVWDLNADPVRLGWLWLVAEKILFRSQGGTNGFEYVFDFDRVLRTTAVDGYQGAVYAGGDERRFAFSTDAGDSWTRADMPLGGAVNRDTDILSLAAEQPPIPKSAEGSANSRCQPKDQSGDARECQIDGAQNTQGYAGDPINTRTGGVDLLRSDLDMQTSAGSLVFQRTYSSIVAQSEGSGSMGMGWTHNHDSRLIFPEDPGGREATVLFKAHTANLYSFIILADGSFQPAPGVLAGLEAAEGGYRLTNRAQQIYTFNDEGRLLRWEDGLDHGWDYQYDGQGRLTRVQDDSAERWLVFNYDADGNLETVQAPVGSQVSLAYDAQGNLASVTDPTGGIWSYAYDEDHRLTRVTDPEGGIQVRYEYDEHGRGVAQFNGLGVQEVSVSYGEDGVSTLTDANGNTSRHVYDLARGILVEEIDALGGVTAFSYDGNLRLAEITDPSGRMARLGWSEDGHNLLTTTDGAGYTTGMAYNDLNRLVQVQDPRGGQADFDYQGMLLQSITDALGGLTTYTYSEEGDPDQPPNLLQKIIDGRGNATQFSYNSAGDMLLLENADQYRRYRWNYGYDDLGRLDFTRDALGRENRYSYDPSGRLTRMIQNARISWEPGQPGPTDVTTEFRYDLEGKLTDQTDPLGRVTHFEYDAADRLTAVIANYKPGFDPSADTNVRITFHYNPIGDLIAITDPLGRIDRTYYDALHRPVLTVQNLAGAEISDPAPPAFDPSQPDQNVPTSMRYDAVGNLVSIEDALGTRLHTCYDARNLPFRQVLNPSVEDPCGGYAASPAADEDIVVEYRYDEVGNLIEAGDPLGRITRYSYDLLNRLIEQTDPMGFVHEFQYDPLGNLTDWTDPEGVVTHYVYNPLSRLSEVFQNYQPGLDDDSETNVRSTFLYDAIGNRVEFDDPLGGRWRYAYDGLDRLAEETDPLGNSWGYDYDALGNLVARTDAMGFETSYNYDGLDRLISIDHPDPDADVSFNYDALGNLLQMHGGLGATNWSYDALYRVLQIEDPFGAALGYAYDGAGRLTGLTHADGKAVGYSYDAAGRLTGALDWSGGGTGYSYDKAGQLLGVARPNGVVSDYGWDLAGRLDRLEHRLGESSLASYAFDYDKLGNRTRAEEILDHPRREAPEYPNKIFLPLVGRNDGAEPGTHIEYAYDPLYRLTAAEYSSGEFFHYSYDAFGNRLIQETQVGETDYAYDRAQRLIEVDGQHYTWSDNGQLLEDGQHTYAYDHAGRLVALNDSGMEYGFAYDGLGNRYQESVGGETTTFSLDLLAENPVVLGDGTQSYFYGLGRIGGQGAGGWTYDLADALGTARQIVDASGELQLTRSYDPFGNPLASEGQASASFGFTGEQTSAGLLYLRARFYDPEVGRFLSRDPFPGFPQQPDTLNPYPYVRNNPVNYVDPSGEFVLTSLLIAAGIGALVGGIGGAVSYAMSHPGSFGDLINSGCFWRQVGIGAAVGAISGLAAGAISGILGGLGIVGSGFWSTVFLGGVSGAVSGGVAEGARQLLTYGRICDPVSILAAIASGAISGALFAGIGYGVIKRAETLKVQSLIDDVVSNELSNVRLTNLPEYDAALAEAGEAMRNYPARMGHTHVGREAIQAGRSETIITIAHEEMHHRLWARNLPQCEFHVEHVAIRFARMKGIISPTNYSSRLANLIRIFGP